MKLSLKIREDDPPHKSPLFKAKLPITVIGLPFLSGIIAGDPSDLSFNLSSNFLTGPSVKLSYAPTTTSSVPFTLSLKSGIDLFGSPRDSPLVISAHFNLFSNNSTPLFSLQIKPQFGHFSLHKSTFSNPSPNQNVRPEINGGSGLDSGYCNGFVSEGSTGWTNITLESCGEKQDSTNPILNLNENHQEMPFVWRNLAMESCNRKDGILSGIKIRAVTSLPVTSRFMANFRWGLNFPTEIGRKLPFLTVDKIKVEKVEEVKKENNKGIESGGDIMLLKSMCNWMRSDLEILQKENWELKQNIDRFRSEIPTRNCEVEKIDEKCIGTNFDEWRRMKTTSGEDYDTKKESRKKRTATAADTNNNNVLSSSEFESELQKAIKAAASSPPI